MSIILTAPEAAVILGCSGKQVRRLILSGKLPAHKIGVEYRIDRAAVDRLKESLMVQVQHAKESA